MPLALSLLLLVRISFSQFYRFQWNSLYAIWRAKWNVLYAAFLIVFCSSGVGCLMAVVPGIGICISFCLGSEINYYRQCLHFVERSEVCVTRCKNCYLTRYYKKAKKTEFTFVLVSRGTAKFKYFIIILPFSKTWMLLTSFASHHFLDNNNFKSIF